MSFSCCFVLFVLFCQDFLSSKAISHGEAEKKKWGGVFGVNTEIYSVNTGKYGYIRENKGKYGPEKTPYLDIFHVVL